MNWLNKVRRSDERAKKKWVIFLSCISMVVVIGFWLWYMSYSISEVGTQKTVGMEETKFWPVFKTGITVIMDSIKDKINSLTSEVYSKIPKIGGERVINIDKSTNN